MLRIVLSLLWIAARKARDSGHLTIRACAACVDREGRRMLMTCGATGHTGRLFAAERNGRRRLQTADPGAAVAGEGRLHFLLERWATASLPAGRDPASYLPPPTAFAGPRRGRPKQAAGTRLHDAIGCDPRR